MPPSLDKKVIIPNQYSRANIFFTITSPTPGTFVISLHYKGEEPNGLELPSPGYPTGHMYKLTMDLIISGRNRGLLELDLKLDDLLEMQQNNHEELDLEYVQFNVPKVLALLNKRFARKKNW